MIVMRRILLLVFIALAGCDHFYSLMIENDVSQDVYLKTIPPIESSHPKLNTSLAARVNADDSIGIYQIRPGQVINIDGGPGHVPNLEGYKFHLIKASMGVDTVLIVDHNKFLIEINFSKDRIHTIKFSEIFKK
jgi:hypothetical protein